MHCLFNTIMTSLLTTLTRAWIDAIDTTQPKYLNVKNFTVSTIEISTTDQIFLFLSLVAHYCVDAIHYSFWCRWLAGNRPPIEPTQALGSIIPPHLAVWSAIDNRTAKDLSSKKRDSLRYGCNTHPNFGDLCHSWRVAGTHWNSGLCNCSVATSLVDSEHHLHY